MTQTINIIDSARTVVATASVEEDGDQYSGTVDLGRMPESLRKLFDDYEATVNDQIFSLLDEVQGRIARERLAAVFGDGSRVMFAEIQIYPSTGAISFKPARMASPAV